MEIICEINADGELVANIPQGINLDQLMHSTMPGTMIRDGKTVERQFKFSDFVDPNKTMISMANDKEIRIRSKKRLTGTQKRALKRAKVAEINSNKSDPSWPEWSDTSSEFELI